MFVRNFLIGCIVFGSLVSSAQKDSIVVFADDPELAYFDSLLVASYLHHFCFSADTAVLNVHGYAPDSVPEISNEQIKEALALLDAETPMELSYNDDVQKFVNLYTGKRARMTGRVLGMAELYFPMFEEAMDKYEIPYEMKYLAIVESALNPEARSRAGAVGLWQFMYSTGKMYDLRINSYLDERRDPRKSTDAACRYLRKLYERFGDWNLALAAYNSGPGNVNKAIRRSGGKKDYWSIRPYLPKETRSYVPAFIAVNYVMNHAADHNIYPVEPKFSFWEIDSLIINQQLKFDQITAFTDIDTETLSFLNPGYRRNVIPNDGHQHILNLPVGALGVFLANEDSIYAYMKDVEQEFDAMEEEFTYRVRSGDVLGTIAQRHGVSVSNLKAWNNLRGNTIYPGQKLVMYLDSSKKTSKVTSPPAPKKRLDPIDDGAYTYHVVQSGDTLWDIAKIYEGVTVDQLLRLNNGLNNKRLQPGQKIKIKKIS